MNYVTASDTCLSVRGVSKKFCRNIKRSMIYGLQDLGRAFVGKASDFSELRQDEFWALKDISFEVKRGESVAVIGDNGSGKSTLCRLIGNILALDEGEITLSGRAGVMMSLGLGFHSHMTGRENILLNGTIVGMTRDQVMNRMEEIISFSELEESIDAPVSTYSAGMKTRLGFAVAAHADMDILVIDEVLAVGDVAFRNKCLRFLQDSRSSRSLVLVSHNMTQVNALCERAILLEKGRLAMDGQVDEVLAEYLRKSSISIAERARRETPSGLPPHEFEDGRVFARMGALLDSSGETTREERFGNRLHFRVTLDTRIRLEKPLVTLWFLCHITRQRVAFCRAALSKPVEPGVFLVDVIVREHNLQPGNYVLGCGVGDLSTREKLTVCNDLAVFTIAPVPEQAPKSIGLGYVRLNGSWEFRDAQGTKDSGMGFDSFKDPAAN